MEEWGGDPSGITMVSRTVGSVSAEVAESQPSIDTLSKNESVSSKAHLSCLPGQKMTNITFASYGTPEGVFGNFSEGICHAPKSKEALEKNCVGQQSCDMLVTPEVFGEDPCPGTMKKLAVEAICD